MLNLTHARTFLTVIAARGIRAAARQLDLAPSTIVDHIRQLEEVLAAPLVLRRRGGANAAGGNHGQEGSSVGQVQHLIRSMLRSLFSGY